MIPRLKTFFDLSKLPVALLAAFSTVTGCLLASSRLFFNLLFPVVGILLLACGASALNQVQERKTDALMERTKGRPLPSRKISSRGALFFSLALLVSGTFVLLLYANLIVLGLGLAAVLWYNGVYTYLKGKTPFAVIPGALVGAIPPAAGWVAGGGRFGDPQMIALALFFFIWQVPHFGLLMLKHGKEYEQASLPSLTSLFDHGQLARIFFIWMLAAGVTGLGLPMLGTSLSPLLRLLLLPASLGLVWNAVRLLRARQFLADLAFRDLNRYALTIMVLLSMEKLLNGI